MVEAPPIGEPGPAAETIVDGSFEEELDVDADSVGAFLVELGEQLQAGREIELTGEGWRIPFTYREPVELEIEFEGGDEPELEIEVELAGDRSTPSSGIV
ncbi:amphi-Trp domain-containing protein [Thermoplasmatales archaeon SW_10_69_26]|jgi:amphi-Trp domain-containing protein|nr:MAG: amphi-Trp domain-containing protein [Thermoplasmatales archaeon SW_10_69_26]